MIRASVVVTAYNEERNIRLLLKALGAQRLSRSALTEIIVVASGCTDRTHAEVEAAAAGDPRIRLLVQDARLGKAAAINAYLRERDPRAEVIVISSADILPQPGCLEVLIQALVADPALGMCGGRPVPTNPRGTVMGDVVSFLWELHHERASESPKLGELIAVRAKLMPFLSEQSAVDEASLEAHVHGEGYALRYVPEAVIANRGPTRLREYFEQRRRIAAGHFWVKERTGYAVSTMDWRKLVPLALKHFTLTDPRTDARYLLAIAVEAAARGVGYLDARRNHSHAVWKIATTAHEAIDPTKVIALDPQRDHAQTEDTDDGDAAASAPAARLQ